MNKFTNDIYKIYELINNNSASSASSARSASSSNNQNNKSITLLNAVVISKQYLAYYLYRILIKFIKLFEQAISSKDLDKLFKLLHIPKYNGHNYDKNYPLVGKMTNDEEILDIIILTIIDMFNNLEKYIQTLPNTQHYNNIYDFLKTKDLLIIIQDLVDLQKLIPGLSMAAIRPNLLTDYTQ